MIELDITIEEPIYLDLGIADEVFMRQTPVLSPGPQGPPGDNDPNATIDGGLIM